MLFGQLAEILGLKEPTTSHQLSKLSAAGLVEMRAGGTVHLYRLNGETLNLLGRELFTRERVVSLGGPYHVPKLEHQIVNIRHISHRMAQLADRLRNTRGFGMRWVGARR